MAPIHDAAMDGDVETLKQLLAEGVSPDVTADFGKTPLHCLCICDHGDNSTACFELLRDAGANLEASNSLGYRPLHFAAFFGVVRLLSLLVHGGVNVDAKNLGNSTALHIAAEKRATDCVEVLLAAGADIDVRNPVGTPFEIALDVIQRRTWPYHRTWPLFLRAGAELPNPDPAVWPPGYLGRVIAAGGFQRYAQNHIVRIASILETPLLPPELVRKVLEYWLHAGYY